MKKLLYLIPLAALLTTSCSKGNTVTGKLSNDSYNGKTVVLFQSDSFENEFMPVDSTVIENGSFAIERKETANPSMAYLVIKNADANIPPIIPFVNENGSVKIAIDSTITLSGTSTNDAYQKFMTDMRSIDKQMYDIASSPNANIDEYNKLNDKQSGIVFDFVKSNIKNSFGEFLLITYASFFDNEQLKSLINEVNPKLQAQLSPFIDGTMEQSANFVGQKYVNVAGDTPDGKKIALSDFVGKNKLVLIDFWASWCGPCIQEMPNVVNAYKQYKSKGFEIVGISLDETKSDWVGAISKLNMTWPQMSDLKGWKSDLGAVYNVQAIPFTLLVNENGEIIAENLRGDQLTDTLEKLLN